jgi:hypothetical protein
MTKENVSHDFENLVCLMVYRTLPIMVHKPLPDTMQMKATETFQTPHILTHLKLFQANRAFSIVNTVLLSGFIWEYSGTAESWGR